MLFMKHITVFTEQSQQRWPEDQQIAREFDTKLRWMAYPGLYIQRIEMFHLEKGDSWSDYLRLWAESEADWNLS